MEIYNQLLWEHCGIPPPPLPPQCEPSPRAGDLKNERKRKGGQHLLQNIVMDDPECCMDPQISHGPRGENAYCMNCGLCLKNRFLELDYVRLKTGVYFTKKRYYAPVTHFKEHLRRYMGARFTDIPEFVVQGTAGVDVQSADAYFEMKKRLKELGVPKLYKEIFTLIYLHGGRKPCIQNDVYEKCIHDFKVIMTKFLASRVEYHRHSMPCNYMLLDLLLTRNGHESYYKLPYLKNDKCRDRVMEIYSDLNCKQHGHFKYDQNSSTIL